LAQYLESDSGSIFMAYTHNIVGNLPSPSLTKIAIFKLKNIGFDINKLSVIGKNNPTTPTKQKLWRWLGQVPDRPQSADLGSGLFGILAGAGMLFMRGVGLVVLAGPIAGIVAARLHSTVQDGQTAFGGTMGAFEALGISHQEALQSTAQIKAGQFVLLVAGSDLDLHQVRQVLAELKAEIAWSQAS
jgi:hypothetical protein